MTVPISPPRVRHQLARRGLGVTMAADRMGVSHATLSRVLASGRARESTVRKLAQLLVEAPVLEGLDEVLDGEGGETTRRGMASQHTSSPGG